MNSRADDDFQGEALMLTMQDSRDEQFDSHFESSSPFAEATPPSVNGSGSGRNFASWSETVSPFALTADEGVQESTSETAIAEAFAALRDETFDEALASLAEETEGAIAERFTSETAASAVERERYGDSQLAGVRFEAQQYLDALEAGIQGLDVASLSPEQLQETLDRFDPETRDLTPAGEEFIGALVRKAKKAVKFVTKTALNAAKGVGKLAGSVLGGVLKKLKALINPLLRRVLSFAIGRLPAPLQPAARILASKITSEASEDEGFETTPAPANLIDVETLAESFDAALAEATLYATHEQTDREDLDFDERDAPDTRELETLAEARAELTERLRSASDDEDLGPAIEQFVPALLAALRLGINVVGRSKVVNFLAGYLAKLIGKWVGPTMSKPLSSAIVDIGLRLISLENENGTSGEGRDNEAAPVALASLIEDTVRRLAEHEDYVFENEDLLQLAAAEAFSQSVATHFPPRFVRPAIQQAPSLGGVFVARRSRSLRPYLKYSRTPEVEISSAIADTIPTFGGVTLGSALRASGATFPIRARLHLYQAVAGTTLPRIARVDRVGAGRGYLGATALHPLTTQAAAVLVREPRLGAAVPSTYLRSRHRIAVGQRFFALEPATTFDSLAMPGTRDGRAPQSRPTGAWMTINPLRGRVTLALHFSEPDAQTLVAAIREGRGGPALLQALTGLVRDLHQGAGARVRVVREDEENPEVLESLTGHALVSPLHGSIRRRLRAWVLPALASWVRGNVEAFARAAAHPGSGVTVRVRLTGIPGLDQGAVNRRSPIGTPLTRPTDMRGAPTISIIVASGRSRR
jgi:hypothetical protein